MDGHHTQLIASESEAAAADPHARPPTCHSHYRLIPPFVYHTIVLAADTDCMISCSIQNEHTSGVIFDKPVCTFP
jgi:hypothetical protein